MFYLFGLEYGGGLPQVPNLQKVKSTFTPYLNYTGVNILAKILISSPTFSLFLPRYLVLNNNRKPLFLLRFLMFAYLFHPTPRWVAIGQSIIYLNPCNYISHRRGRRCSGTDGHSGTWATCYERPGVQFGRRRWTETRRVKWLRLNEEGVKMTTVVALWVEMNGGFFILYMINSKISMSQWCEIYVLGLDGVKNHSKSTISDIYYISGTKYHTSRSKIYIILKFCPA